jgi:hypothetical protein
VQPALRVDGLRRGIRVVEVPCEYQTGSQRVTFKPLSGLDKTVC